MWTDEFKASKFGIFKNKIDKSSLQKTKDLHYKVWLPQCFESRELL